MTEPLAHSDSVEAFQGYSRVRIQNTGLMMQNLQNHHGEFKADGVDKKKQSKRYFCARCDGDYWSKVEPTGWPSVDLCGFCRPSREVRS